jgi:hypothetical protein
MERAGTSGKEEESKLHLGEPVSNDLLLGRLTVRHGIGNEESKEEDQASISKERI